jgi:epoxide hydrolase-like predicted phosphatase
VSEQSKVSVGEADPVRAGGGVGGRERTRQHSRLFDGGAGERRFDAIVFDLSGVVIASAFDAIADTVSGAASRDEALALLLGPYGEDTDHVWHQVERGEVPIAEWVAWVADQYDEVGIQVDWDAFGSMMGRLTVHDVIVERIRSLRADGYLTALCTNNVKEGSKAWRERVPVEDLFDAVVDSSEVGMRKPDPRIFAHTLELLDVADPGRAIFLDDHPGNIAGAERAGLVGLLVGDPAEAVIALDRLLAHRS